MRHLTCRAAEPYGAECRPHVLFEVRRPTIQHVRKTAVQPRLAGRIVVPDVDRLVVDVRVVAAEAIDLLGQSGRSREP